MAGIRFFAHQEEANTMKLHAADPPREVPAVPPAPGKVDPVPPEMPLPPGMPAPEDMPTPVPHPQGPPGPIA
jgi:hypothetical protein